MFPASSKGGGQCALPGPLDVCKTPSPGGPIPLPYPNIAMVASSKKTSSKVKFCNKDAVTMKSEIPSSNGDNAGTAGGGVVSSKFMDKVKFKKGASKVKVEGKKVIHATSMTAHNGSSANAPPGLQVAPSQVKVIVS